TVTNLTGDIQVSACVAPANNPCQTFSMFAVALSALQLKIVRGTGQMVTVGQVFEPVVLRVTDSSPTPNPVQGAGVTFQSFVLRERAHLTRDDKTVETQLLQSAVSLNKLCARTIGHSRAGLDPTDEGVCPYTGPRVKDPSPSELAGEGARATQCDSHNPIHFF